MNHKKCVLFARLYKVVDKIEDFARAKNLQKCQKAPTQADYSKPPGLTRSRCRRWTARLAAGTFFRRKTAGPR